MAQEVLKNQESQDGTPVSSLSNSSLPRKFHPPRKLGLPILLFLVTCLSTYWAGIFLKTGIWELTLGGPVVWWELSQQFWPTGLTYMASVMAILFAHEMGHFLQAVRYRIPTSLPFFIPMPFSPIGTMGAVLGMRGTMANRKELFDIGLTGPLAGLIVALPILCWGILRGEPTTRIPMDFDFQNPLLMELLTQWLRKDLQPGVTLSPLSDPLLMAGWVGLFLTGLNMMPISQLDGGHVTHALFGGFARWIAYAILIAGFGFMMVTQNYTWSLFLILVLIIGPSHPPTADDHVPLGWKRQLLGLACLAIPILCFQPIPMR